MFDHFARQRSFWISFFGGVFVGLSTYAIFSSGVVALLVAAVGAAGFMLGEATTKILAGLNAHARKGWVTGLVLGVVYVLIERVPEEPSANLALAALYIIFPVILRPWIAVKWIGRIAKWVAPKSRSAIETALKHFNWDDDDI
jgi:hypothetical protein